MHCWTNWTVEQHRDVDSKSYQFDTGLSRYQNKKFVWRTWAGPGGNNLKATDDSWLNAQAHNHLIKTLIHKHQREQFAQGGPWTNISSIGCREAMGPHLFPSMQQISRDIPNHFGVEAWMVFQMWINHMMEQEWQKKENIKPCWLEDEVAANDCLQAGQSVQYCPTQDQIESKYESFLTITKPQKLLTTVEAKELEMVYTDFCLSCQWQFTTCQHCMDFLMGQKKTPKLKAIKSFLETHTCSNQSSETMNGSSVSVQ